MDLGLAGADSRRAGQRLEGDEVQGAFDARVDARAESVIDDDRHLEALCQRRECSTEAAFGENDRIDAARQVAQLRDRVPELTGCLLECGSGPLILGSGL